MGCDAGASYHEAYADRGPTGGCVRCATCDGFPCWLGAKSDAETCAIDPALAETGLRLATGTLVRRVVTDGPGRRVSHLVVEGPDGLGTVRGNRFVLSAGAVNSAALLLASADEDNPGGLANSSGLVGRNFMMHNNAHVAALDLDRRNDVTFQKTLSVNDWYADGGDGRPLGTMQLIGRVDEVMMKSWATKVPLPLLRAIAARSVEWLVMSEDLPSWDNRVTFDSKGRITTARKARGRSTHRRLHTKAKEMLRGAASELRSRARESSKARARWKRAAPSLPGSTRPPASSTRGAAATTSRTSGSSMRRSSRRRLP